MALIKCEECGKEISDKAIACPHCGNPLVTENLQEKKNKTDNVTNTTNKEEK